MTWTPTRFERSDDANDGSSTGVVRIQTDAGPAHMKALGNAEGPHALARDWVGMSLARWFGLTPFDFAVLHLPSGMEIRLGRGKVAEPGPALVTRTETGNPWSGDPKQLGDLVNREDVTGLVILDTWLLNEDRFPPEGSARRPNYDNVFLSREGLSKRLQRLVAMDFTHCLRPAAMLSNRIGDITNTKDEHLYGLFPAFEPFLSVPAYEAGLARLRQASEFEFRQMLAELPSEWEVDDAIRTALARFLVQRAAFLVEECLPVTLGPIVHLRGTP